MRLAPPEGACPIRIKCVRSLEKFHIRPTSGSVHDVAHLTRIASGAIQIQPLGCFPLSQRHWGSATVNAAPLLASLTTVR